MKNATVMNDNVQEIRKILEEYLGNRKAAKVAVELSTVIQGEIKYNDNGEVFFVHKDKEGKLVLTTESVVKRNVQTILQSYLEEDELQECIESLMAEKHETEETEKPETNKVSNSDTPVHTEEPIRHEPKPSNGAIEKPMTENNKVKATEMYKTILIPGSDDTIYKELLNQNVRLKSPNSDNFMDNLKKAVSRPVKEFKVFVYDPSWVLTLDGNGHSRATDELSFLPGKIPVNHISYDGMERIAEYNGVRFGTKDEYILFLGWLISVLINEEGWPVQNAWDAVCYDSSKLGRYATSETSQAMLQRIESGLSDDEITGTREISGKCDLAGFKKMLAEDEEECFYIAGGGKKDSGKDRPLSYLLIMDGEFDRYRFLDDITPWFVPLK